MHPNVTQSCPQDYAQMQTQGEYPWVVLPLRVLQWEMKLATDSHLSARLQAKVQKFQGKLLMDCQRLEVLVLLFECILHRASTVSCYMLF